MSPPCRRRHGWVGAAAGLICLAAGGLPRAAGQEPAAPPAIDLTVLARQAALDRAGFSPGILDGKLGRKTLIALDAFQTDRHLPRTGEFDAATLEALAIHKRPTLCTYTVTAADLADVGGPLPDNWNAKAKLDRLRYESLSAVLAERGHCSLAALQALNPGRDLDVLKTGATVSLPEVTPDKPAFRPAALEINLTQKLVRVHDEDGRTRALFHCSIARLPEKRPRGSTTIITVAFDPVYVFKPEMWPEVTDVDKKLLIPAGPRNPVGLCWIGLARPGYGIHGTPNPELIGKTGSHGCFRLTNWDAQRLGGLVREGMPVRFVE
jgi:lipoprotein-anchoring transpeptidase ErfK/SrfK